MKRTKKFLALLLALCMMLSMAACGADTPAAAETTSAPVSAEPVASEELGSGSVKWSESTTEDGWVQVTNEGGETLGYSADSGVKLIQVDGFAFKDLNRNGQLDVYEDWRNSDENRARNLASQMTGEQIAPYLTHGGWGTFTTDKQTFVSEDNAGYAYITAGGRGGVTRNAGGSTEDNVNHAKWSNLVQELCESLDYGIPAMISIDPNGQSGVAQTLALASSMDPELAVAVGKAYSEQYRAMGVSLLLGPQIDLMTSPVMDRGTGTYGEDPALTRDITEGFVSGMQSTWAEDGSDMGWGSDSVLTIMKHYSGAGASEGGRDDHNATGKYAVFENNNFEAHLIPFHDGAFNLTHSATGSAGGIMTNYSVSYSEDGSLGELKAGAWSEFKYNTLFGSGWSGFIISDWGIWTDEGKPWGMEEYTVAERVATAVKLGMTSTGGFGDMDVMAEAWDILVDDLGEKDATALMQDRAYENILVSMRLGLFENPYCSTAHVRETNWTDEAMAFGLETQLASVVMLKNDGTIQAASGEEKKTVYIPYSFTPAVIGGWSSRPSSCDPGLDLDLAAKYFNVVTDTVGEPSGTDADGNPAYTADDIIRASAADIAACDMILVGMNAPHTPSTSVTDDAGNVTWLPASIQYGEYTAATAKETSISGDKIVEQFNDGYTVQTKETKENRSYKGNTASKASAYGSFETLNYCVSVAGDAKIVVLMSQNGSGAMVWSEVEPVADVILNGYDNVGAEAFLMTVAGLHEPSGLLVTQQPASMEAVEAQTGEDTPRDLECYVDAAGNAYDFAYGLNWSGVIKDDRVTTYSAAPLTECVSFDFQYAN